MLKWEFENTYMNYWSIYSMISKFPWPDGTPYDNLAVQCETFVWLLGAAWLLFVGPVAQCMTLLALWTSNTTKRRRENLCAWAQGLWRWQVLDVFVFMVALGCICHHFLSLYVNEIFSKAGALSPICEQIHQVNMPCLVYEMQPAPGLWVLIVAVAAQVGATLLVHHEVRRLSSQEASTESNTEPISECL